jgi:hypothetical protein
VLVQASGRLHAPHNVAGELGVARALVGLCDQLHAQAEREAAPGAARVAAPASEASGKPCAATARLQAHHHSIWWKSCVSCESILGEAELIVSASEQAELRTEETHLEAGASKPVISCFDRQKRIDRLLQARLQEGNESFCPAGE